VVPVTGAALMRGSSPSLMLPALRKPSANVTAKFARGYEIDEKRLSTG
jgi:hypothetical protein